MSNRTLPRSRFQRAFFNWLRLNKHRLATPVLIKSRTDHWLTLAFPGKAPALLRIELGPASMTAVVDDGDITWDLLWYNDVAIQKVPGGYLDKICIESEVYPCREALWTGLIFEPLLDWINNKLAPATYLSLGGTAGGSTWAELIYPNTNPEHLESCCLISLAPAGSSMVKPRHIDD